MWYPSRSLWGSTVRFVSTLWVECSQGSWKSEDWSIGSTRRFFLTEVNYESFDIQAWVSPFEIQVHLPWEFQIAEFAICFGTLYQLFVLRLWVSHWSWSTERREYHTHDVGQLIKLIIHPQQRYFETCEHDKEQTIEPISVKLCRHISAWKDLETYPFWWPKSY